MSKLDEAGRALLALASNAHDPTERDRARVRAALAARLGVAAGLGIGATVGLAATAKATVAGATGIGSTSAATAAVTGSALAAKLVVAAAITATVGLGATVKLVRRAQHTPAAITTTEVRRRGPRERTVATAQQRLPAREAAPPEGLTEGAPAVAPPPSDETPPAPSPRPAAAVLPQADIVAPEGSAAPRIDPVHPPEPAPQVAPAARPATEQIAPSDARAVATHHSTPSAASGGPACGPGRSGDDAGLRRSEFTVADETHLLRDGVRALREGQPACALSLLDAHARYYPKGVLAEEREAERALALADLGRVADARAAALAFLRNHPASPLGARLRQRIAGLKR